MDGLPFVDISVGVTTPWSGFLFPKELDTFLYRKLPQRGFVVEAGYLPVVMTFGCREGDENCVLLEVYW